MQINMNEFDSKEGVRYAVQVGDPTYYTCKKS